MVMQTVVTTFNSLLLPDMCCGVYHFHSVISSHSYHEKMFCGSRESLSHLMLEVCSVLTLLYTNLSLN